MTDRNIYKEMLLDLEVGRLEFDGRELAVYRDLNDPLFLVNDIGELLGYQIDHEYPRKMLENRCEVDEVVNTLEGLPGPFVTETGLYNIFSQEHGPLGRKWRRVVHDEIVKTRRQRGLDIIAKFDEWDHALDDLYFDEETGILMRSVTVAGGDVEQVPFKMEDLDTSTLY